MEVEHKRSDAGTSEPLPPSSQKMSQDPISQDNWKHRSLMMKCGTCMFFVKKSTSRLQQGHMIGRCRQQAPTMKGWPVVFSDDWCGAHKLDEEKI